MWVLAQNSALFPNIFYCFNFKTINISILIVKTANKKKLFMTSKIIINTGTFEKQAVQRVENITDINHYAVNKY